MIDKVQSCNITKIDGKLNINWDISEVDIRFFKSLKLEINKIIKSLIDQTSTKQKVYKSNKTIKLEEIFHPFSGLKAQKLKKNEHIWAGSHDLNKLGSLSPTIASHFLKMKEYENAGKNMYNNTYKK